MPLVVLVSNDNTIKLSNLTRSTDNIIQSAATVSYNLKDTTGSSVDTGSMTAITGEPGAYRATIADTVTVTAEQKYTCEVTADNGAGEKGFWVLDTIAQTRVE